MKKIMLMKVDYHNRMGNVSYMLTMAPSACYLAGHVYWDFT